MRNLFLLSLTAATGLQGQTPTSYPIKLSDDLIAAGDVSATDYIFSPDGTRLLYRADQFIDESFELFSVPASGGTVVTLNDFQRFNDDVTEGGFLFSPDSSIVIYHADQDIDEQFELYTVSALGGTTTQLNDNMIAAGDVTEGGFIFSPDSSTVIYHANQVSTQSHNLYAVDSEGGTTTKLNSDLAFNQSVSPTGFQYSPDGSRMIYHSNEELSTRDDLFTALTVTSPLKLTDDLVAGGNVEVTGLQYSPDGSQVIYLADQRLNELFELFVAAEDGSENYRISGDMAVNGDVEAEGFQFSPDGSQVLYVADQRLNNLYELFITDPSETASATRLSGDMILAGDVVTDGLQFSPDGEWVLYLADALQDGKIDLFSVPSEGGTSVRLNLTLPSGGEILADSIRITEDSESVLYLAQQELSSRTELYLAPIDGEDNPIKINATLPSGGNVLSFELQTTSAGQRVVYLSDQDVNDVFEIFSASLGEGLIAQLNPVLVAGGDVESFRISPDGEWIAFVADLETFNKSELYLTRNQAIWNTNGEQWSTDSAWLNSYPPQDELTVAVHTETGTLLVDSTEEATAASLELGTGLTSGEQSILQFANSSVLNLAGDLDLYLQALITGDGHLSAPNADVDLPYFSGIEVAAGETLQLTANTFSNGGSIEVRGSDSEPARLEVDAIFDNNDTIGTIRVANGELAFPQGLTNNSIIVFESGTNEVSGSFNEGSDGSTTIDPGAEVTFLSALNLQRLFGTGKAISTDSLAHSAAPGSLSFSGDLQFADSHTLTLEIGGTTAGSEHDQVAVANDLTLDGTLEITLSEDYLPTLGDEFTLLTASTLAGDFTSYSLPALPAGLFWQTSQLSQTGLLTVGSVADNYLYFSQSYALAGDFEDDDDSDGIANGLEYALGTNPTLADTAGSPILTLARAASSDQLLTTLAHPAGDDIILTLEASTDLQDDPPNSWITLAERSNGVWSDDPPVTVSPQADGYATITFTINPSLESRRFYRLRATLAASSE